MDIKLIDEKFLDFLRQTKGIIALGYFDGIYPVAEPKFVVDVDENENSLCFIESDENKIKKIRNSKSVSVSLFDWSGKVLDGYQLKGTVEVFSKGDKIFEEIIQSFISKSVKPLFLNEFLSEMEEEKIIPQKNFVVKITFNIKYSHAPTPDSAKPLVVIK